MECPCSPLKKMLANNLCLPLFQLSPGNKMFLSKIRFKTSAALMPCAWQASPHAGAEGPRMVCVRLKLAHRKARLEKSTFLGNAAGFAQSGLGDYQSQSVTPGHGHPHVTLFVCPRKPPGLGPRKLLGLSCWWIGEKGETAGIRFWLRDRQALWKAQVPMHRHLVSSCRSQERSMEQGRSSKVGPSHNLPAPTSLSIRTFVYTEAPPE